MKKVFPFLFFSFVCIFYLSAYSYLPIVTSYDKYEYEAGRQNWDLAIDDDGIVYFANNKGLLRNIYGIWQLNPTTTNDLIRSILIKNDTIWCGGTNEFGYFVKTVTGDLSYHAVGVPTGGSVWNIESFNNHMYFQTEFGITQYNKSTNENIEIKVENGFYGIKAWGKKLWAVTRNGEIGTIENKTFKRVLKTNLFSDIEVRQLFIHQNKLHLLLFNGKVYTYDGNILLEKELPPSVANKAFFSSCSFNENSYCIGTISDGFVHVSDNDKEIITSANSDNGLIDNTVLSIDRDAFGNVWLGLDYGIAFIELQNAIKPIFDQGASYYIKDFENKTYIATNKGLFSAETKTSFNIVPGSEGQVWRLKIINNELWVCHNIGLLKLTSKGVETLFNDAGVVNIEHFKGTNEYLITTYSGLFRAHYDGKNFELDKMLIASDRPKLAYDKLLNCIWGAGNVSGLNCFSLDNNGDLKTLSYPDIHNFFCNDDQFIFYNDTVLLEYKSPHFSPLTQAPFDNITGPGISTIRIEKNGNNIAYIQNGVLNMLLNLRDGNYYSYKRLLSSIKNNLVQKHEFIDIVNGELRIATDRGVLTFNPESQTSLPHNQPPVISKMEITLPDSKKQTFFYPFHHGDIKLASGNKDILLHFGISKASSDVAEFRYRLWPYDKDWSNWDANNFSKSYTKLKGGSYKFELESRLNKTLVKSQSLAFSIEKYWYQSKWIILIYLLVVIACVALSAFILNRITKIKVEKEQVRHGRDFAKRTITIKNEQLLQYAEIIGKKNEFLMEVKEGLSRMRNTDAKHWEQKILNEVNNEKKNFFFHKLFSELHQDFINRLTEKHPSLTPHDVRILSFIRINLGTTEIANLMNISPKSVDINRYRIRKKLELPHETDLNLYIREL